eukprot:15484070-Alexandrium_andersonii.AAC.1
MGQLFDLGFLLRWEDPVPDLEPASFSTAISSIQHDPEVELVRPQPEKQDLSWIKAVLNKSSGAADARTSPPAPSGQGEPGAPLQSSGGDGL